jgi:hypothetical protein
MSCACFYYCHHHYSTLSVCSRVDMHDRKRMKQKIGERKRITCGFSLSISMCMFCFCDDNNGTRGYIDGRTLNE